MDYQQFKETVVKGLEEEYPNETVSLTSVKKNNGVEYDGIVFREQGQRISPTIYLQNYYQVMISEEDIADTIHMSEYQTIHQKQAEGIAAAKAKGIKMGRPPRPLPNNFYDVYQKWKAKKISTAEAARLVDMPVSTFRYRASIYKNSTLLQKEK